MIKRLLTSILLSLALLPAPAQNPTRDFKPVSDSLRARLQRHTTVKTGLKIEGVTKRGSSLEFTFSQELSDYQWTQADLDWLKDQIYDLMPAQYSDCTISGIFCRRDPAEDLITPALGNKGRTSTYLTIFDMLRNPDLSLRDAAYRQYKLGGEFVLDDGSKPNEKEWKIPLKQERVEMLQLLEQYIKENRKNNYAVKWSEWKKK